MGLLGMTATAAAGLALLQAAPEATRTNAPTATAPSPATVPATRLGINLANVAPWMSERPFSNMIAAGNWLVKNSGTPIASQYLDRNGFPSIWPTGQADGQNFAWSLMQIPRPLPTEPIICTWQGKADMGVNGLSVRNARIGKDRLSFTLANHEAAWITVNQRDPSSPLTAIDCREASRPRDEVFDPNFIRMVRDFKVVRFMDWQRVNGDNPVNWETRRTPDNAFQGGDGGVALDYMVKLAVDADIEPWFTMPFQADDNYIRAYARFVHEHLPADRTIYIELGNEIWNTAFPAARRSQAEGLAKGLSSDPTEARMRNYAARAAEMFAIWSEVFADRPGKLVRVVSTQSVQPRTAEMVLSFPALAGKVDALATAPYFYLENEGAAPRRPDGTLDLDRLFPILEQRVDTAIDLAVQNKAVAARHGVRYIAYEGGQHLVFRGDAPAREAVQRDPRMGALYTRYLDGWQRRVGDLLVLFNSTSGIGDSGSWGLREYSDQPLSEAPKAQAVDTFLKQLSAH